MEPFILLASVLFFGTFLYRYMKKKYGIFEENNIPGPKPMWVFGNIKLFKDRNPLDVFIELRKTYGNIYGIFEGFRPSIVINDPEMSKQVLTKHFDKFHERPIYNPFIYYPDEFSLLNCSGQLWRHQRTVVATAFAKISSAKTVDKVIEVTRTFLLCLSKMQEKCPEGFNIAGLLDRFTLDAFALSAFNYHVNSLTNSDAVLYRFMMSFNKTAAADNPIVGLARVYPSLVPFLKLFDKKHRAIHEEHLEEMKKLVKEQRQLFKNKDDSQDENILCKILTGTFSCKDDMGKFCKRTLSDEEVLAHLHSLVGGGLGTSNATLEFIVHCLAVHPEVQQKVYEEITSTCGINGDPDNESLERLKYMDMVINESVRVFPVAPGVARMCVEDCEINGVHFKAGTMIRLMLFTLYSDDKYFPDHNTFIPERFSEEAKATRHPYTFLPFGQGPRACIGMKYGMMMTKTILVKLLQKYALSACSQTMDPLPTALKPMLTPKDGVFVKVIPRKTPIHMTSHG